MFDKVDIKTFQPLEEETQDDVNNFVPCPPHVGPKDSGSTKVIDLKTTNMESLLI